MNSDNKFKNPAESYKRSIDTKQAWDKYANHYKQGIHRRALIDRLTNNKEDKFEFKEQTKRDYSLSNKQPDSIYAEAELVITDGYKYGKSACMVDKNGNTLGYADILVSDENPEYIEIEHAQKEKPELPYGFFITLLNLLKDTYKDSFKGVLLIPVNEELKEFYKSVGFTSYISPEGISEYLMKDW